jgi:hypothetical protein
MGPDLLSKGRKPRPRAKVPGLHVSSREYREGTLSKRAVNENSGLRARLGGG